MIVMMLLPEVVCMESYCAPEIAVIFAENVSHHERQYLDEVFSSEPDLSLEVIWRLMDAAWQECCCDPSILDERIDKFYSHPVWLLNGLFVEQHADSLDQRLKYCDAIAALRPTRVADIGGGFGTLARMIGKACPEAEVHIVEPHPFQAAIALANKSANVRYVAELSGQYDVLLATDVFEHASDPLGLVEVTASHLRQGGSYLMHNCFWPVIRCHLPDTFHFRWSWNRAMAAMNLKPSRKVAYGWIYNKTGSVTKEAAKKVEGRSQRLFHFIEHFPLQLRGPVAHLLLAGMP